MSAEPADRQGPSAGGTVRLTAVHRSRTPTSIARYRILSELGQGAMARVYLALDPNINRKVALKVLEPRGLVSAIDMDELRTRFLLEARAAGNLRHPAAVAVYDADHDPETGQSFIAMEWVDGQSLDHLLRHQAPLPADRAIGIICQVAGALDAAHAQGLIHRDVKPANILLDGQGNAKLSDFGIAKAESLELTSTGQVLGTPFYMSPEQIRDEDLDGRSDLFSLGVVLYQAVTGTQPFHAGSLPALTHKILHTDPTSPRSINPEISERLESATLKALQKEPDQRFQTGAELAQSLTGKGEMASTTLHLTHPSLHAQKVPADSLKSDRGEEVPADSAVRDGVSRPRGRLGAVLLAFLLIASLGALWKGKNLGDRPPGAVTTVTPGSQIATEAVNVVTKADTNPRAGSVSSSTLQISYTNRLKSATMTVWVDGETVLNRSLYGPRGFFKRAVGRTVLESIPVAAGHHDVRVTVRGTAGKIEASNRAGNTFEEGQTRRLRVELIPPSYLKLDWR